MSESTKYRVRLVEAAHPSEDGLAFPDGESREFLAWDRVRLAFAAEVGEPEGVRTIVFDLVVEEESDAPQGGRDPQCTSRCVFRLDADPGEDAMALARAIENGLGSERPSASIKSVATDGVPSRWYPDIETFEEAVREQLDQPSSSIR